MVGAIERIEREINELEAKAADIARELHRVYEGYLQAFAPAMERQFILAAYHLCTQGYPDDFLELSLSQRQQLQSNLRQLGRRSTEKLLGLLSSGRLLLPGTTEEEKTENNAIAPELAIAWQEQLETGIDDRLQTLSQQTNQLLQEASILPEQLPPAVLEVATQADPGSESIAGPPNVLTVTIQARDPEDLSEGEVTQLMAVRLRRSEIEFANASLHTWRTQVRQQSHKLAQLQREYDRKLRLRAVAQAEAAWRSTWFEEQ